MRLPDPGPGFAGGNPREECLKLVKGPHFFERIDQELVMDNPYWLFESFATDLPQNCAPVRACSACLRRGSLTAASRLAACVRRSSLGNGRVEAKTKLLGVVTVLVRRSRGLGTRVDRDNRRDSNQFVRSRGLGPCDRVDPRVCPILRRGRRDCPTSPPIPLVRLLL